MSVSITHRLDRMEEVANKYSHVSLKDMISYCDLLITNVPGSIMNWNAKHQSVVFGSERSLGILMAIEQKLRSL